ncbi:betaine/proline/choline family ABC transporter ATP-binding protein [Oceanobacillus jeddahense]|uniref:Quaternary amine transport ATP-binding protein n=1 Tax=Oceanobacillus jeddahense TaxID=1462527 RepID=A0ABY5JWJ0_9BACI|nr:betaine/proline/choline family ABC transporter ATP-binding protein [Oceanobacillus jeddahense]UUI04441.1 betaine/proline/choline family ABC transporter ATP-binding protein [Oceanobacillus jeddahense]
MIELKNIGKTYEDGFQALKDINLEFEDGKINVLIGPSGCGKTTTMKLLNRLVDYTSGDILLDGESIKQTNPIELRRKMGFVIQNIGLFPHMNIYNNVATVPKLLKWDKDKIHQRVMKLLDMVNLEPDTYMNRYPSELSGGQQQRIGVIRALAAEPGIILMDEPFSALDPISREQLQDELIRLQSEINKTIIFVTHDMDEAIKIADQIILMKDGSIVQQASPEEILKNPANDFVKGFIGANRLEERKALPPLATFIQKDFLSVSTGHSIDFIINQMVQEEINTIPVVNENDTYQGLVHLYELLGHKNKSLQNLLTDTDRFIHEKDSIDNVLNTLQEIQGTIPIIDSKNKMVGILDANKLFKAMTENKCGVA